MKKITYNGSSKVIINIIKALNDLIDGASSPSASDVSYDNTGSGLSADDVQEAIDELAGDIPTKTSDLTNDSGFITNAVNNLVNYYLKSETYTQAQVDALISAISTMHFEVVASLPVSDIQTNVIYLVPSSDPGTQNIYDEYINTTGTSAGWELIGSTQVDLSDYVTTSDLATALADYVTSADLTTILANYVQSSALATVATSGNYDDLTNKPTIPAAQVQSDWNQADSTAVDYIKNKPSIPSSSGHTIWNRIKTALTSRVVLWFADASVSDASADGATKIEVLTELADETAFDNLPTDGTADGMYAFPDGGNTYLDDSMVAHGSGTVKDALDSVIKPSTMIYPVVFATSLNGGRYYAGLPTLPKNMTATLSRVNVMGTGDVSTSNYTLAYDSNTGYGFIFTTQNSDWSGKSVMIWIDFT